MTAYVHTPRQHQPDRFAALLAEKARIEAETRLYETLAAQRQQLAEKMAAFHKHDHPAEQIRQVALIINADTPEACAQRLNEATNEAIRWVDPRTRPAKGTK